MTGLDLFAARDRVSAYAQLICTRPEFLDQKQFDATAHAAAEVAPKLLLEVERLQKQDRAWADTVLAQRDTALEAVARVRKLLRNGDRYIDPELLRKALDGGETP